MLRYFTFVFVFACFRSSVSSHVDIVSSCVSISFRASFGLLWVVCRFIPDERSRCVRCSCSPVFVDVRSSLISVNSGLVNVYLQSVCQLRYTFISNFGRNAVSNSGSRFVGSSGCKYVVNSGSKFVAKSGSKFVANSGCVRTLFW